MTLTSDPKTFRDAYLETIYEAGGEAFQFSSLEPGVRLYDGRRFSLVTAANPRSVNLSDARNVARHLEMQSRIEARGWRFDGSLGRSPSGGWREHGFLIWDSSLEEVLALGRDFEQNAVVFGEAGRVALVWCDSGDLEWFVARRVASESQSLRSE